MKKRVCEIDETMQEAVKPPGFERSCGNKARLSERDAWARAKRLRKFGEAVHAYHCPNCGDWHIGKDNRLVKKLRERS